jgi:hypothetical protein
MTEYKVTLTFQYPAWDEKGGIPFYVMATSKSYAIRQARYDAVVGGHIVGAKKGRYWFKAVPISECI